ncbi:hypothetical protein F5Y01DRAFT_197762 [Xylaria sp. FL0043]|nr:hypothetical protein F5Y01DRAFT_197762 [Xylaria sp. FL0043]
MERFRTQALAATISMSLRGALPSAWCIRICIWKSCWTRDMMAVLAVAFEAVWREKGSQVRGETIEVHVRRCATRKELARTRNEAVGKPDRVRYRLIEAICMVISFKQWIESCNVVRDWSQVRRSFQYGVLPRHCVRISRRHPPLTETSKQCDLSIWALPCPCQGCHFVVLP